MCKNSIDKTHDSTRYQTIINNEKTVLMPGGTTLNVCRAFQWMLKETHSSVVVGALGDDEFGKLLTKLTVQENILGEYSIDERSSSRTARCAVLITDTERTLLTDRGTVFDGCTLKKAFYSDRIQQMMQNSSLFFFTGYSLGSCEDIANDIGKYAAAFNKIFCFGLAAPFIVQKFKDPIMNLIPFVDILAANEDEAWELNNQMKWKVTIMTLYDLTSIVQRSCFNSITSSIITKEE
jgi:adenosine kinase